MKEIMNYRRLGKAGVKVSELSLGSWVTFGDQISDEVAEALMIKAYDGGVNFFDNAEGYASGRSELVMGKILRKLDWPRDTWLVSSKVFFGSAAHPQKPNQYGLSRKHVFEACHAALKRLQVDYLDLFFLPSSRSGDADRRNGPRDVRYDRSRESLVLGNERLERG